MISYTMDYNFHIPTARLFISHLNPSKDAHCDFVFRLVHDVEGNPEAGPVSLSSADRKIGLNFIVDGVDKMQRTGYGRYLISLKSKQHTSIPSSQDADSLPFSQRVYTPIGVVTMQLARFPCAPTIPDIGFGLLRQHFGHGYATEAAQGLLEFFEDVRGQRQFAGYCSPENEGSKNVFKRLGFEERGMREIDGVLGEGKVLTALVWTKGVDGGEGALKIYGI